jgi:hypothetical protein
VHVPPVAGHTVAPPAHMMSGATHFCVESQQPSWQGAPLVQHDSPGTPHVPVDVTPPVHMSQATAWFAQFVSSACVDAMASVVPADVHLICATAQSRSAWNCEPHLGLLT